MNKTVVVVLFSLFLIACSGCGDREAANPDAGGDAGGPADAGPKGPGGVLEIKSSSRKFAEDVAVGCTGQESIRVTFRNTGAAPLNFYTMESVPGYVLKIAEYSMPHTLAPGAAGYLDLYFAPYAEGTVYAELRIGTDASNSHNGFLSEYIAGTGYERAAVKETFDAPSPVKTDFLICIDATEAMQLKQYGLPANVLRLPSAAGEMNIDYNIGIITSEFAESRECSGLVRTAPGMLVRRDGSPRIVANHPPPSPPPAYEPSGKDPHASLASNLSFGICSEQGKGGCLEAIKTALTEPNIVSEDANLGFRRSGARLVVWIVSNSEDRSPGTTAGYASFLGENASTVVVVSPLRAGSGGTLQEAKACDGDPYSEAATRYVDLCGSVRCMTRSICNSDWFDAPADLSPVLVPVTPPIDLYLSGNPDPTTIEVTLGGKPLPQNNPWGWTYDAASNRIGMGDEFVFPPGSVIEVSYKPVCTTP